MSCAVCLKPTDNTTKCFTCKKPFCTSCLSKRVGNKCPSCAPAAKESGGGGGGGDWVASFEDTIFGASNGKTYLINEDLQIPFKLQAGSGMQGMRPKVAYITSSGLKKWYNPEDMDSDSIPDALKEVMQEFECHGTSREFGSECGSCGKQINLPEDLRKK